MDQFDHVCKGLARFPLHRIHTGSDAWIELRCLQRPSKKWTLFMGTSELIMERRDAKRGQLWQAVDIRFCPFCGEKLYRGRMDPTIESRTLEWIHNTLEPEDSEGIDNVYAGLCHLGFERQTGICITPEYFREMLTLAGYSVTEPAKEN